MKLTDFPQLVAEWDAETNEKNGLFLDKMTHGMTKKAEWICPKGHHFQARIDHRVRGSGCPFCSGDRPVIGENDFATLFPVIAEEWDYSKNSKAPSEYLPQSNKKVAWICGKCGNKYDTTIQHRSQGGGCPECAKKQRGRTKRATTVQQVGSIVQTHPEIAAEWDYEKNAPLLPDDVSAGCNQKVWWIGKECSHSYDMTVSNRCIFEMGCPVCGGNRLVAGFNDLATTHPEIANYWHPTKNGTLKPTEIMYGTDQKVWWLCERGHEWETAPYAKRGCPVCASVLRTSFPEQSVLYYLKKVAVAHSREKVYGREVDIWLPDLNCAIEYNGQYWHNDRESKDQEKARALRDKGIRLVVIHEGDVEKYDGDEIYYKLVSAEHETLSDVIRYIFELFELPFVDIDIVRDSTEIRAQYYQRTEKSIATKYPELMLEWDFEANAPLTPDMVPYGSNQKYWWKCKKCYNSDQVPAYVRYKSGCPFCAGRKPQKGVNDLETLFPELYLEWNWARNTIDPNSITTGSKKRVWWKCRNCGHEWDTMMNARTRKKGTKCPNCRKSRKAQYYQKKEKSIASEYPHLLEAWDAEANAPLTPDMVSYGSNQKVWWKCAKCSNSYPASAHTRNTSGCPYCAGRRPIKGVNDLETQYPDLLLEWNWEKNTVAPDTLTTGSNKKVWWICKNCGHEWETAMKVRTRQGCGCPQCNPYGGARRGLVFAKKNK